MVIRVIRRNCRKVVVHHHHPASRDRSTVRYAAHFLLKVYIAFKTHVFIQNLLSQGQDPASKHMIMTQWGSSLYKAKLARQIEELWENAKTASHAANHFKDFPTVDSAFGDGFTVLPTFVPTDTLEHLKNCIKNTRKSADSVVEFASSEGLRMLSFLFTTSKWMRV